MGKCIECGYKIKLDLDDENLSCPSCNTTTPYKCWNCYQDININGEECSMCGFFVCENCSVCGKSCDRNTMLSKIIKLLQNENFETCKIHDQANQIFKIVEDYKQSRSKLYCPKGVPKSYATSRIRMLLQHCEGYKTKTKFDKEKFMKRLENIINLKVGDKVTIETIREEGRQGYEERDALNTSVCRGFMKKKFVERKNKKSYYEVFEKQKNCENCEYFNPDVLPKKKCPNCNQQYEFKDVFGKENKHCNSCVYKKGKNKNQPRKLNEIGSKVKTCQLDENHFVDYTTIKKSLK